MHISVLILVANDKHHIERLCEILDHGLKKLSFDYEIIFLDNASRDGTAKILDQVASRRGHVRVVTSKRRCSFGEGLRALLEKAQGDIVVYSDALMPVKLDALPFLMEKMRDADLLIASRFQDRITAASVQASFSFWVYRLVSRFFLKIPFKDLHPGLLMMHREVIPALALASKSKNIFPEIFIGAKRKKLTVQECFIDKRLLAPIPPTQQSCSLFEIVDLFRLKS
ncbi:MAG TPA: glycosyltransferase [Candidatus Omnitrophota bacterium]|nr:glycosyltransferase [Candidatus Omnitrophota bacterium]HQL40716.1 glycosyltransferase [Candidatus Omnitrophota bacterium]